VLLSSFAPSLLVADFLKGIASFFPVHGFDIDATQTADASQVGEQPLKTWLDFLCVVVGSLFSRLWDGWQTVPQPI
jgi:hypothetical protein